MWLKIKFTRGGRCWWPTYIMQGLKFASYGYHFEPYSIALWLWLVICHGFSKFFALFLVLGYMFVGGCGSQTNFP
jgi:hypothetical protein